MDHPEHNQDLHDAYVRFFAAATPRLAAEFIGKKADTPGPDTSMP